MQSEELVQKKSDDIVRLNANLYDIKGRLVETETQLKENVKESNASEKRLNRHIKYLERQWREERLDYEEEIRAAERKFNRYQYSMQRADDIKKRRVAKLSEMLHKRKFDVIHANNQRLMVGFKLSNRERQIAAKNRAIFELKESLALLDQEIIYLREKLRDQYEFKQMLKASSAEEDIASRKIFDKQQSLITDLKDKLTRAQEKIKTLSEEDEAVATDKIKELKTQLQKMQEELQKATSELKEHKDVYDVMEKRLADAQERAKRAEEIVQEKEEQIGELEEQLTNVLTQFE